VGSRVVKITVGGQPLDLNQIYSVATNNFVAGGGDGYTIFTHATDLLDTQFVDADVLADFIRDAGTISPQVEGRIQQVGSVH
jgi:5'-nucleotidase